MDPLFFAGVLSFSKLKLRRSRQAATRVDFFCAGYFARILQDA
jgi:hypothetical protein